MSVRGSEANMELSNVGDRVFAAERILKKRTRRVNLHLFSLLFSWLNCRIGFRD